MEVILTQIVKSSSEIRLLKNETKIQMVISVNVSSYVYYQETDLHFHLNKMNQQYTKFLCNCPVHAMLLNKLKHKEAWSCAGKILGDNTALMNTKKTKQ